MLERPVPPYEEVEHTADLALRVHGSSLADLFVNAATGMFHLMFGPSSQCVADSYSVCIESLDTEALLVDWLNELLFLSEIHGRILSGFELVHISETCLNARVSGGPMQQIQESIKAATFHDLSIQRDREGYTVTIVFDV